MNQTELIETLIAQQAHNEQARDVIWVLITTFAIFLMQCGFLLLESGAVSASHSRTIMMKNICDGAFGAAAWYFVGHAIYTNGMPAENDTDHFVSWMQSYVFAITTATILSGGVACRIKLVPYFVYATLLCAWIYPVIARMCWGDDGWIKELGYKDFAGSGPVHCIGGISAGIGAWSLKPRAHRFNADGVDLRPPMSSEGLVILGMFILWFGWLSFNAGSSAGMDPESLQLAIRAAMNTLLGSSFAAITGLTMGLTIEKDNITPCLVNSVLGGLVAITAGCAFIPTWAAMLIGLVSPLVTLGASRLFVKFLIDDPLDAFAVHGANGIFGVLLVGLFDEKEGLFIAGNGSLFLTQLIAIVVMVLWAGGHAVLYFCVLSKVVPMRVSKDAEIVGLDAKYFGNYAEANLTSDAIRNHKEIKSATNRLQNQAKVSNSNSGMSEKRSGM